MIAICLAVLSSDVHAAEVKLTASHGAAYDAFGYSVAISGDTVVVGSPVDDIATNPDQGSASVFVRSAGIWTEQAVLTASDGQASAYFGWSVAISGNTLVVGAPTVYPGSAYVFVRTAGVWTQQAKLTGADAGDFLFGTSVGISGDTIVVGDSHANVGANSGQGRAYVFIRNGGAWMEQARLTASDGGWYDLFGSSVGISGNTVVVGAPSEGDDSSGGSAYVFGRTEGAWSEQAKLTASDRGPWDYCGASVAISRPNAEIGLCLREHAPVSSLQRNHVLWIAVQEVDDVFDRQRKAGFERLRRDSRTVRSEDHVGELGQRMACG